MFGALSGLQNVNIQNDVCYNDLPDSNNQDLIFRRIRIKTHTIFREVQKTKGKFGDIGKIVYFCNLITR